MPEKLRFLPVNRGEGGGLKVEEGRGQPTVEGGDWREDEWDG